MHDKEGLEALESPIAARFVEDSLIDPEDVPGTFEDVQQQTFEQASTEDFLVASKVSDDIVEPAPVEDEYPIVKTENDTGKEVKEITNPALRGYLRPSGKGNYTDYETFSVREARVVAIPPVVDARTIVRVIPTQFPIPPDQTPPSTSDPYVHVYTCKPTAVDLPGPLFKSMPIKPYKKSQFSPLPANHIPNIPPSPRQIFTPNSLSAKYPDRPPTSYSWLGALFQPIDSEIVDAQKQGWMKDVVDQSSERPWRKFSQRLKKTFSYKEEQVTEEVSPSLK